MERDHSPQSGNPGLLFYVLWGALVSSGFVYGVIVYVLHTQMTAAQIAQRAAENAAILNTLTLAFTAVSVTTGALALFALPNLMKSVHPFVVFIVRLALCESICIYGLVLSVLGASPQVTYSFIGAGAFCLVVLMPTRELIESAVKANRGNRDSEVG